MHEDSLLGKKTEYIDQYDASLIFPISRVSNRAKLNLPKGKVNHDLPFFGVDVWTGYEVSWLNRKGKPVVVIAEFIIPCHAPNIVESKSFKLYLNSFNQTQFDEPEQARVLMAADLSKGFGVEIDVRFFNVQDYPLGQAELGLNIDDLDIEVVEYEPNAALLKVDGTLTKQETLHSHLLKSNCPVTNQPDWATVIIRYQGSAIDHAALLKYIISYRGHDDFHEHCVEQIFCDLMACGEFDQLSVCARYTRRGGLDINPTRSLQAVPSNQMVGRLARQ